MKAIHKFNIGSSVFFKDMEGYIQKDNDVLCIVDKFIFKVSGSSMHTMLAGDDLFIYKDLDKRGFIDDALESEVAMRAGKFLVPEFAEYLGMTIGDLQEMDSMFRTLDDKHKYELYIYEAYVKNNNFTLTEEQRQEAYKIYKEARQ